MMTSRQSSRPWDAQRWNLAGERRLDPHTGASCWSLCKEVSDLRGLSLIIQFGRTETFFHNESSNFLRFVLLHRLQEPLVTPAPVLTLGVGGVGGFKITHHHHEKRYWQKRAGKYRWKEGIEEQQHLYSNTGIKKNVLTSHFEDRNINGSIFFEIAEMSGWREDTYS